MVRSKEKLEKDRHSHGCSVDDCKSLTGGDKIKFFRGIRANKSLTQKWIYAINRSSEDGVPWQPTQTSRICGRHFLQGQPSKNSDDPNSIPSLFLPERKRSIESEEKSVSNPK